MAVGNLLTSGYWLSRLVDQRTNNNSTEVAVIDIYCNYLQENGELILDILREIIQTIYDESKRIFSIHSLRKVNIRITRSTICFRTTTYMYMNNEIETLAVNTVNIQQDQYILPL